MALDNFKKTSMRIDKANQRFLDYQNAKVGDVNGRELLVQITNNGVVEDQTGTTLKLNWQHENGNQDSTSFSAVDIKQGKYSLYYPKEMLYKGSVDASIEIISNGQTTNTMNFKIIVHADVFNGEAGTVNGVFISLADVNKKLDDREKEYTELKSRQTSLETQFDNVQQDLTDKDIVSAPEIIAARNGEADLKTRLDKEQQEVTAQLAQTESILFNTPPTFSDPITIENINKYDAWPNDALMYDEETDEFVLFINSKSAHFGTTDAEIYMIKKKGYGNWSSPVLVAEGEDSTNGRKTFSCGILPNGNYMFLATAEDVTNTGKIVIYESNDKGLNWTSRDMLINGNTKVVAETSDFLITNTGRILTWARNEVLYSDDNGGTWQSTTVPLGQATIPLEGNMVQLSDGTIIALVRTTIGTAYTTKKTAGFTKSTDNGLTWTPIILSADVDDMTENNASLFYDPKTKTVEAIVGSRFIHHDGKGSLYHYYTSEENAKNGLFGKPTRIFRTQGVDAGNSGYPAFIKSKTGTPLLVWYDGFGGDVSIRYAMGNATGNISLPKETEKEVNELTKIDVGLFEQGNISPAIGTTWVSAKIENSTRLRLANPISVKSGESVSVNITSDYYYNVIAFYEDGTYLDKGWSNEKRTVTFAKNGVYGITIRRVNETALTPEQFNLSDLSVNVYVPINLVKKTAENTQSSLKATRLDYWESGVVNKLNGTSWQSCKVDNVKRLRFKNSVAFKSGERLKVAIDSLYSAMIVIFYQDGEIEEITWTKAHEKVFSKAGTFGVAIKRNDEVDLSVNNITDSGLKIGNESFFFNLIFDR